MTLPQLPTDNLYKFMFLAGLTIMGLCSILYVQEYGVAFKKLDNIEVDMLKSELTFYKDTSNFAFELKLIDEYLKKESGGINNFENLIRSKKKIPIEEISSFKEEIGLRNKKLLEIKRNVLESEISNHVADSEIAFQFKKIKEKKRYLLWISIFCGLGFFIGLIITVSGYNSWKSKVQDPNDEKLILELKKLKSEIKQSLADS